MKEKVFNPPLLYNIPPPTDKTNVASPEKLQQTGFQPFNQFYLQGIGSTSALILTKSSQKNIYVTKFLVLGHTSSQEVIRLLSIIAASGSQKDIYINIRTDIGSQYFSTNIDFNPPLLIPTQNGQIYLQADCTAIVAADWINISVFGFEAD